MADNITVSDPGSFFTPQETTEGVVTDNNNDDVLSVEEIADPKDPHLVP